LQQPTALPGGAGSERHFDLFFLGHLLRLSYFSVLHSIPITLCRVALGLENRHSDKPLAWFISILEYGETHAEVSFEKQARKAYSRVL
jgi:hypothetical protein